MKRMEGRKDRRGEASLSGNHSFKLPTNPACEFYEMVITMTDPETLISVQGLDSEKAPGECLSHSLMFILERSTTLSPPVAAHFLIGMEGPRYTLGTSVVRCWPKWQCAVTVWTSF